jgi:hypothetical protein
LGDLTSTGSGLQLTIEPSNPVEADHTWRFFPPRIVTSFDEALSYVGPSSPAQSSFSLLAGAPLTVVIPQLSHLPSYANVSVSDTIVGNVITVNATMRFGDIVGNTLYGPQEYLLPIGGLDVGDYHLTMNVTTTNADDNFVSYPTFETGFANFTVLPVPEPSTGALSLVGLSTLMVFIICRQAGK